MNRLWMVLIMAFVLAEKVVPRGDLFGRLTRVALMIGGLVLFTQGLR